MVAPRRAPRRPPPRRPARRCLPAPPLPRPPPVLQQPLRPRKHRRPPPRRRRLRPPRDLDPMRLVHSTTRRAFSLLEMMLALAIGMLLLLALYVAFDMYFGQAQSGREIVNEAALARSILTRIGNDIVGQIGPVDPRVA